MAASGAVSEELLARTQRNLVEFHWRTLQEGPGPRRVEWAGAVGLGSDLPTEVTNTLFVLAPITDPDGLLREARAFFRPSPTWRVTAPGPLHETWASAANVAGLRAGETVPRMVLAPIPRTPPLPVGLTVRRVETARELRDFCRAAGRGFRIPEWYLRIAFTRGRSGHFTADRALRLFVGYLEGAPVATSAAVTSDRVTGIFFVATVPRARRRGLGAALTWAAIDDGRRLGAEAAWLQSSIVGRSMYERIGFRRVHDDYDWVSSASGWGKARTLFRLLGLALAPPPPWPEHRPRG
jgi:ribosomal protein S18 acetylase RimI-like enzyme